MITKDKVEVSKCKFKYDKQITSTTFRVPL